MSEGPGSTADEQSASGANRRTSERAAERADELEQRTTADGTTIYVVHDEDARGSDGPFHVAYADPDRERRYGWVCGNCGSVDTAMDPMGRVECNRCGNRRKPTEWDPAHE